MCVPVGIVEVADNDEGNSRSEPDTLGYFLLALLAPFLIDVVPEHFSLDHIQRQSRNKNICEHPADASSEDKHCKVKPVQDHPQRQNSQSDGD